MAKKVKIDGKTHKFSKNKKGDIIVSHPEGGKAMECNHNPKCPEYIDYLHRYVREDVIEKE